MVAKKYTAESSNGQITCSFSEYEAVFSTLNDTGLLQRLEAYRLVGRKGHSLRALWRAFVCSYLMGLPSTNALIRTLEDRPDFRIFCGFRTLPHRTTFNRFFNRLSRHANLVEQVAAGLTKKLKALIPDLGEAVAVDSTVVYSHSRPRRKDDNGNVIKESSDPEAGWTAKHAARAKTGGKEWYWGFKVHMVADVNHGMPLGQFATTASRNDSPELPNLIDKTESLHDWFKPKVVIGDRGYDANSNHQYLYDKGIIPIIHIRKWTKKGNKNGWIDGIYTTDGEPTCLGNIPMKYVKTDPTSGHRLYRCAGCALKNSQRGGIRHCDTEVWEDPMSNIKLFGADVRRGSPQWWAQYNKRQAIERVFKSIKESRRLNNHCFRGLQKVSLHAMLSTLTVQASALVKMQTGRAQEIRWLVRKVA